MNNDEEQKQAIETVAEQYGIPVEDLRAALASAAAGVVAGAADGLAELEPSAERVIEVRPSPAAAQILRSVPRSAFQLPRQVLLEVFTRDVDVAERHSVSGIPGVVCLLRGETRASVEGKARVFSGRWAILKTQLDPLEIMAWKVSDSRWQRAQAEATKAEAVEPPQALDAPKGTEGDELEQQPEGDEQRDELEQQPEGDEQRDEQPKAPIPAATAKAPPNTDDTRIRNLRLQLSELWPEQAATFQQLPPPSVIAFAAVAERAFEAGVDSAQASYEPLRDQLWEAIDRHPKAPLARRIAAILEEFEEEQD